jgi:hypothetical protein
MPNLRTLFLVGAGVILGLVLTSVSRPADAEAGGTSCSIPKNAGALRAVKSEGWFVFEDSEGTVRVFDSVCKVKRSINRQ